MSYFLGGMGNYLLLSSAILMFRVVANPGNEWGGALLIAALLCFAFGFAANRAGRRFRSFRRNAGRATRSGGCLAFSSSRFSRSGWSRLSGLRLDAPLLARRRARRGNSAGFS